MIRDDPGPAEDLEYLSRGVAVYAETLKPGTASENASIWILKHCTRALSLLGGGWPKSQRDEWLNTATDSLCDLPAVLVMAVLEDVVLRCRHHAAFVPMVLEKIDPRWEVLRRESANCERAHRLLQRVICS